MSNKNRVILILILVVCDLPPILILILVDCDHSKCTGSSLDRVCPEPVSGKELSLSNPCPVVVCCQVTQTATVRSPFHAISQTLGHARCPVVNLQLLSTWSVWWSRPSPLSYFPLSRAYIRHFLWSTCCIWDGTVTVVGMHLREYPLFPVSVRGGDVGPGEPWFQHRFA